MKFLDGQPITHRISIDHLPADGTDNEAFAAFCDECTWRGDWHHADVSAAAAEAEALVDLKAHETETSDPNWKPS